MSYSDIEFIAELEQIVRRRLGESDEESYTVQLVAAGTQRIAQKVGEEGVELALAAVAEDRQAVIGEAADLLFHMIVLLVDKGVTLDEVTDCLRERHVLAESRVP